MKIKRSHFLLGAALLSLIVSGCGSSGTTSSNETTPGGNDATAAKPENGQYFATAYEYSDIFPNDAGNAPARPLPAAKGNSVTGDKIIIGLVASENGELKPWGDDSVKGAQLAVDEFNAAGGVNGKQVDLHIEDSASKPEQGKSACQKLISDGAIAVVGEVASGITAQMAQVGWEKGVPIVAIGATRTDLTNGKGNVFRVCYTDAFQGPVMAHFAFEKLGLKNVAIMTDKKQPYSTGLSDSFKAEFTKLGGKIAGEEFYESGQTQFAGQLTNLKSKQPDGMFCSGYFTEVGPIVKQAKEGGMDIKFFGGDGWDSSEILNLGGDAINGTYFCNHYNNQEDREEVKSFLEKWKKANDGKLPATTMGALSYDATMVVLDALKNAKSLDSASLIAAIDNTESFPGVSGSITLKGHAGNPPKRALVVEIKK